MTSGLSVTTLFDNLTIAQNYLDFCLMKDHFSLNERLYDSGFFCECQAWCSHLCNLLLIQKNAFHKHSAYFQVFFGHFHPCMHFTILSPRMNTFFFSFIADFFLSIFNLNVLYCCYYYWHHCQLSVLSNFKITQRKLVVVVSTASGVFVKQS